MHKYTKVNSSRASLQYCCIASKFTMRSNKYFVSVLCCLSLSSLPWRYPKSLFRSTDFGDFFFGYRNWHVSETSTLRDNIYNVHILHATRGKMSCSDIPEKTRLSLPLCKKESRAKKKESKAFFMCLLREERRTSYKSLWWQPCKYLCSQARLRLTAQDVVAGELGVEPSPSSAR